MGCGWQSSSSRWQSWAPRGGSLARSLSTANGWQRSAWASTPMPPKPNRQAQAVAAGNGSMRWREATDVSVAANRFSPHRLGQRKSHDKITQLAAKARVAAGGDHNELFAVWARLVRHRRRLAAGWKFCAPEFFPRRAVERAEVTVQRGCDQSQSARRRDRPAHIDRAPGGPPRTPLEIVQGTERHLPAQLPGGNIDGGQGSPGWFGRG